MLSAEQKALVRESNERFATIVNKDLARSKRLTVLFVVLMIVYCFIAHGRDSVLYIFAAALFGLASCINLYFVSRMQDVYIGFRNQS